MARGVLRPMVRITDACLRALILNEQHRNLVLISPGFHSVIGSTVISLASSVAK